MRIAVTYDNGMIYQDYDRSPWVKIYDFTGRRITNTQLVKARGFLHRYSVTDILKDYGVKILVTGNISFIHRMAVSAAGIDIRDKCAGNADHAVRNMIDLHMKNPSPVTYMPKRSLMAPRAPQHRPAPRNTAMRQPAPRPARMPHTPPRPKPTPAGRGPQPPQAGRIHTPPADSRGGGFRK